MKMKIKYIAYSLVGFMSAFTWSCKAPEMTADEKIKLPDKYVYGQPSLGDTTTMADMKWEEARWQPAHEHHLAAGPLDTGEVFEEDQQTGSGVIAQAGSYD